MSAWWFGNPGLHQAIPFILKQTSQDICSSVVDLILRKQHALGNDTSAEQRRIRQRVKTEERQHEADKVSSLDLSDHLVKAVELAQNKGSSSWLTALPLEKYNLSLSKSEFRDAISLRYGWLPERLPAKCVCSDNFTIDPALSAPMGLSPLYATRSEI